MNLQEVVKYLSSNKYILISKGKFSFSKKFYDEYQPSVPGEVLPAVVPTSLPVVSPGAEVIHKSVLYTDRFIQFVQDAQVPARLEVRGKVYYANKYNEQAAIAFHKMLEKEGVDYSLIVKSTMLYYKSGVDAKKAIGNYILQGDWRTDYEELKNSAQQGEQELNQHIKKQLDNGEYSPFRL